jgi:quercetin dioxygenase-like cupin family protein
MIENKYMKANEATINRPEGDRVIDAPVVIADIDDRIDQLKDEKAWDKNDRNGITLVKNDRQTIVLTCLHADAEINDNLVDGILTIEVLDGRIRLVTEVETYDLKARSLATLRANVPHSIKAEKRSVLLITNHSS